MGPLASAAFVNTLYELNRGQREQDAPAVVLFSNPAVADRSSVLLDGSDAERQALLDDFVGGLRVLSAAGCVATVVCCVTIHHLFPALPASVRAGLLSLVDLALTEVAQTRARVLLAGTTGMRRLRVFEHGASWPRVADRIVLPDDPEQQRLHDAIYHLKREHDITPLRAAVRDICRAHRVTTAIAGCTELHLLTRTPAPDDPHLIDPLSLAARQLVPAAILHDEGAPPRGR